MKSTTKTPLDELLGEIVKQWEAGQLEPDDGVALMIEANCAWASRFISADECAQLRLFLRTILDTDPRLLDLAGREAPRED